MKILRIKNNSGTYDCDGTATGLPVPATQKVDLQDIDASTTGRNQKGKMIRDRVVGGADAKRKVYFTWTNLRQAEISKLLRAIGEASFQISYNDPYTGGWRENVEVYAGDRSVPVFKIKNPNDSNSVIWESLTVNFIEM